MRTVLLVLCFLCLVGCQTVKKPAPVVDVSDIEPIPRNGVHSVKPHETLYSIAWQYGLDYRTIVKRNHLAKPYQVASGEKIYLKDKKNKANKLLVEQPVIEDEPASKISGWRWPARGKVIGVFSGSNKGVNIAGQEGSPVVASAAGKVVYSGTGLRAYGNLIIIKHNSLFLTAYAHNKKLLVKQGDSVRAGQKIAEMGKTGSRQTMLHFEIRKRGRPVNPLMYLK